jgi:phospholipase C
MTALDKVETIVMLVLENRSFDHLLGHLSYGSYSNGSGADGITKPLKRPAYLNPFEMEAYYPHEMHDGALSADLPHCRDSIAMQLNKSTVAGTFAMNGFAQSYFLKARNTSTTDPDPMGFLLPHDVPMSRFLADNFSVCDRWFSSLPAGTQPNRLMAWTGTSLIEENGLFPPRDLLVLDWMEKNDVRYRVYTSGLSFFILLKAPQVFGPNFRNIDRLAAAVANERPGDFPQVIIIEPSYGDTARITGAIANDYHAPAAAGPGEVFLRRVYDALTRNAERWTKTVLIVTFDEHRGFYDHVPPPAVTFKPPRKAHYAAFESLGVRVPGFVVSPFVSAKRVCSTVLDHTSILQFLAEKFTPGKAYSAAVEERKQQGVGSVSAE